MPWRRKRQFTPVFLPGEPHGQRSWVDHSPQHCKESDTTAHTHTHGTLRPDSELPGSKSERGMMTNDKASPHLSIRSSVGRNIFPALHCQSNFAFRALRKRVRKQKFNVNLRANAVVKFQSQSKKVKQMGTCLVPTAAAWLVHRAYCEKNSRPHGGQAEKRADD